MVDTVKFLGSEITLTTANTVGSASVVRLVNTDTTASTITQKNGASTVATFTLGVKDSDYGSIYVVKPPTHTLEASGGTVKAVSVGFY